MDRQAAIILLENTFNNNFELLKFSQLIKEIFNRFDTKEKSYKPWKEFEKFIKEYSSLGSFVDKDNRHIEVLTVNLIKTSSRDRARTMQRNFVAKFLRNYDKDAALVAFYGDDPTDWRFSFVKMEYDLEKGQILTPARRYSYLVGKNEPNHTAKQQLLEVLIEERFEPTLELIEEAFSIEKVTQDFFNEYKELYFQLKESLDELIEKNHRIKREFEKKYIGTEDFSKKLLGQVVFLYFLQKKGWLGVEREQKTGEFRKWGDGPKNFLRRLFERKIIDYDNFFNDILEPLFYEALATDREDSYYSRFKCKIPFLNGGLFEPINGYSWTDVDILLKNDLFKIIFDKFDRYNFTVKEDEPLDKEVAVDPEMLGKVFENLLEIKDRRSKGSYYTPREIVHFMCQQALINYLTANTNIDRDDIEKYIQLGDFAIDILIRGQYQTSKYGKTFDIDENLTLPESIKENFYEIDRLLSTIKIVDPAVGSGAFPVGMMNEIVKARTALTPFFKEDEHNERTSYELKIQTIENCLYGVDIDSSAVDIAQLRCWLSLIVDELNMEHIRPLPNLDHKFMCGHSLLEEFEGNKLFDEKLLIQFPKDNFLLNHVKKQKKELYEELHKIHTGQKPNNGRIKEIQRELVTLDKKKQDILAKPNNNLPQYSLSEIKNIQIRESQTKIKKLRDLHSLYFKEQNRKLKKQYGEQIDKIEWELIEETLSKQGSSEAKYKLQKYKKNKSKPFFLWKLYFPEVFIEKGGFDIVIANPPYIQLQKIRDEANLLQHQEYTVFNRTGDIYCIFYEKGISLLREKGFLVFISSNTWMRAKFGEKLRNFFAENTNPLVLINFEDVRIFYAATVETAVILIQKSLFNQKLKAVTVGTDFSDYNSLSQYLEENKIILDEISSEPWIIIPKKDILIKKKIEEAGVPIKFWKNISFYRGILTGYNDAFFIGKEKRKELLEKDPKNKNIINPLIRGRNIGKYYYEFDDIWLINTHNGLKKKKLERVDVKRDYPTIYNHLLQYEEQLKPRSDQGDHWTNLRNCAYLDEFEKEKIVWLAITDKPKFAIDTKSYVTAPAYFMTSDSNKYLMAILNSKVSEWYLDKITSSTGQGTNQWSKIYVEQIPIKKIPMDEQKSFKIIVDYIIYLKKQPFYNTEDVEHSRDKLMVKYFEQIIDAMVYELYFGEELHQENKFFIKYIEDENLPLISSIMDDKTNKLREIFERLFNQNHPIRKNIYYLDSLDFVRIIEGKNENLRD